MKLTDDDCRAIAIECGASDMASGRLGPGLFLPDGDWGHAVRAIIAAHEAQQAKSAVEARASGPKVTHRPKITGVISL